MKTIVHTGDLHLDYDPKKNAKARASLNQLLEFCGEQKVNVLMISGDLWDRRQREPYFNSPQDEGLGIRTAREYLLKLSDVVEWVVITKGNNAHDEKGSIAKLHNLAGRENILAYEYPVVLAFQNGRYVDLLRTTDYSNVKPELIVPMIPYPTKELLVRETSIDQTNLEFNALFDGLMTAIGLINDKFSCPKAAGFHGNVQGARLSNGQSLLGQDIIISPHSLNKMNCDYYGLAHIHLRQEIQNNMRYSGSLYNKDWGETEQKSFEFLEFDDNGELNATTIPLTTARPMITVDAEFIEGKLIYENSIPDNAEVRFRFKVPENETSLISEEMLNEVKQVLGEDVRIEKNIIPVQRESRSETIMQSITLTEEVEEYGKVIGEEVTASVKKKIAEIEVEGMEL